MLRFLWLLAAFFLLASCGETVAEPVAASEPPGKAGASGALGVSGNATILPRLVSIKDNSPPQFTAGPYVNPDTANYVINATAYFNGTVNESILPLDISFNEPMDTSAVLLIDIPAPTPRPLDVELKWLGTAALRISFRIGAGGLNDSEEILKIPVMVSGLKDIAGNKIVKTTVGAKAWEGLLVLMYANGVPQP